MLEDIKIAYINGYNGRNSNKAKILKQKYNATHIVLKNKLNIDKVCKKLKKLKPDIVVASSTGCYVADRCKYDKAIFIYLNPLTEIEFLEKLGANISHLKKTPTYKKNRIVLLNKDDELLDYKKAKQFYKDENVFIFKSGGHKFNNIEKLYEVIDNPYLYNLDKLFWDYFSKKELKEIVNKSFAISRKVVVINTEKSTYELFCDLHNKVEIEDLDSGKMLSKKEFLKRIRNEELREVEYMEIDE